MIYFKWIFIRTERGHGYHTMGFFDKLKQGLSKTKINFGFKKVDEELLEELEENLVMADVGFETTEEIISNLRTRIKKENVQDSEQVKQILREELTNIFDGLDQNLDLSTKPSVILMVGVNGSGKTTSIGKIANKYIKEGKKVLLAAGDTFRAAAVEQLEVWANRAGAELIKENEDPSSVIFNSCRKAKEINADILICDTAGRLQNKKYLMDELEKMRKVIDRELPDSSKEVLLVLDGSTGQNAISQLKSFKETTGITGLVLTKLDGTAKGGIVIRLAKEEKVPVKFIGVGEKIDDMEAFNSKDFINAII